MSRIKINVGNIEAEYEGSEDFIKSGFLEMVKELCQINNEFPKIQVSTPALVNQPDNDEPNKSKPFGMTTKAIATKLNYKSGPQLVIAASLYLSETNQGGVFNRTDILREMKTATGIYSQNMRKNLSSCISQLMKSDLKEITKNQYTLNHEKSAELKRLLGI